ncbi:MAG: signal peptidase I [Oscillospiraceae bacterium]|nr:signal peptidase I [Oscillospiraceae bacterium]
MEEKESKGREVRSWLLTVIVPVLLVLVVNLYICKLAVVKGDSMYPTLYNRDLLLVWMVDYTPKAGDIIIINTEKNSIMQGDKLVKRVIATGGQTVQINYDTNTVLVDGCALTENYLNFEETDPLEAVYTDTSLTVPEGYVFVMGDNRNHSADSRDSRIGLIPISEILGVKIARIPIGSWFGES